MTHIDLKQLLPLVSFRRPSILVDINETAVLSGDQLTLSVHVSEITASIVPFLKKSVDVTLNLQDIPFGFRPSDRDRFVISDSKNNNQPQYKSGIFDTLPSVDRVIGRGWMKIISSQDWDVIAEWREKNMSGIRIGGWPLEVQFEMEERCECSIRGIDTGRGFSALGISRDQLLPESVKWRMILQFPLEELGDRYPIEGSIYLWAKCEADEIIDYWVMYQTT